MKINANKTKKLLCRKTRFKKCYREQNNVVHDILFILFIGYFVYCLFTMATHWIAEEAESNKGRCFLNGAEFSTVKWQLNNNGLIVYQNISDIKEEAVGKSIIAYHGWYPRYGAEV